MADLKAMSMRQGEALLWEIHRRQGPLRRALKKAIEKKALQLVVDAGRVL